MKKFKHLTAHQTAANTFLLLGFWGFKIWYHFPAKAKKGFWLRALSALLLFGIISNSATGQNAIVLENQKTGNPASEWDVAGAGNLSTQGFATDISVNKG